MSSMIRSKKKCVICGHEHVFGEVFGTNATGYMDLDTRPPMMKRATLPYEIQMCDKCFYSNSDIETRIPGLNIEALKSKEYLRVANNKEIDSTAKAFWLAALLHVSVADYREAGILFLNAAWIFDDLGEIESAKLSRLESHKYLSIFVEETEDMNLAVLTVDLQRRMGDFSDAIDTANQLISYGVDEFLEKILKLEIKLCSKKDASCHNVGEVK